jgi:hypothetical protein
MLYGSILAFADEGTAAEDDGEEDGTGDGTSSKKPVRKSRAKKAKISVKAEGGEEEEEE